MNKVVIVGEFQDGNGALYLEKAFQELGFFTIRIGPSGGQLWSQKVGLLQRVLNKLGFLIDRTSDNRRLLDISSNKEVSLVFIIKGRHILPKTLRVLARQKKTLILWTDDNMFIRANYNRNIKKNISLYDYIVTQKLQNIDQYKAHNAKNIVFFNKAYCQYNHKPIYSSDPKYLNDVIFIGHYEKQRAESILALLENGVSVKVFGPGWKNSALNPVLEAFVEHEVITGEDYCKYITNSKITLCFLRQVAGDSQTGRTMEIPACRGCMVAEWSEEHENLFIDGQEAVFFKNDRELVHKTKKLLSNIRKINAIKKNGFNRVTKGENSFSDRISELLRAAGYD